jgi:murein DD-endopeptidase MepM/ murein hydrolase activator NlpD
VLLLIVVVSLGAVTMLSPHEPSIPKERARVLGALYAVPLERVETHVLSSGETLSGVLANASIVGREFAEMLMALREHQSPRRLSAGTEVTIRRWVSSGEPRAVDIRLNADSTVRLARTDLGWRGEVQITPVVLDTVYTSGVIDEGRTLYEAIVRDASSNLPPAERIQLVGELADIYEYKLDFTREIQPGDAYRLVYERERRPDGTARRRRILISEVQNRGLSYSAVWFDGGPLANGYFDRDGRALKSGFSRYPIRYPRVTSNFSWRRYHPILGRYRAHLGTDYGANAGEPVRATASGIIVARGVNGGYGNLIEIRHANGYTTRYAHLSRFASELRRGGAVTQGQTIGYVGSTGLATAPHLHYELRQNGKPIDARSAKLPDGAPVPRAHREAFAETVGDRLILLDRALPAYAVTMKRGAGTSSDN